MLTDDERLSLLAAVRGGRRRARSWPAPPPTTPPTPCTSRPRRPRSAWPASSPWPVLQPPVAGRDRRPLPGRRRRHRPAGDASTTSPSAPGARSPPTRSLRLAREVPNVVALKDAAGNPAETARLIAPRARQLRGLQRRRQHDPSAAGRRRRRRRRRGHPLVRRRRGRDARPVGQGRRRRRPARQRPAARELGLRDRRRGAEPGAGQGHAARDGPGRRGVPPADGADARLAAGPGPRGPRPSERRSG